MVSGELYDGIARVNSPSHYRIGKQDAQPWPSIDIHAKGCPRQLNVKKFDHRIAYFAQNAAIAAHYVVDDRWLVEDSNSSLVYSPHPPCRPTNSTTPCCRFGRAI